MYWKAERKKLGIKMPFQLHLTRHYNLCHPIFQIFKSWELRGKLYLDELDGVMNYGSDLRQEYFCHSSHSHWIAEYKYIS